MHFSIDHGGGGARPSVSADLPPTLLRQLHIVRSRRRATIGIRIYPDRIQVNAPIGVAQSELLALLAHKCQWIEQRLASARARLAERPVYRYEAGERWPYLGNHYPLVIALGTHTHVALRDHQLHVCLSRRGRRPQAERVKAALTDWYKAEALSLLEAKSRALAGQLGEPVGRVAVKFTRSKWGHCTSAGDLQYNWLILQAAPEVVDYLVAHEVSHLRHPNHSAAFWRQVEKLCPHYAEARRWLKRHGHSLSM